MAGARDSLDPATARQILGVEQGASEQARTAAVERLRAHVEARLEVSSDPAFREDRLAELARLDELLVSGRGNRVQPPRVRGRRWLALWAVTATATALVLGVAMLEPERQAEAGPPQPAWLSADADIADAELWVLAAASDEVVARGAADGTPVEVESGDYRLRVASEDCPDEWREPVSVASGDQREFAAELCRGEGGLVVRSNVSGDRLRIDGNDVGVTGKGEHDLRVGRHRVHVDKPGYLPWQGEVVILPDDQVTLYAELERDPKRQPERIAKAASKRQANPAPEATPAATAKVPATKSASPDGPVQTAATQPAQPTPPPSPSRRPGARDEGAPPGWRGTASVSERIEEPGSRAWSEAIKRRLLAAYDANGSGQLDRVAEVEQIPCAEWRRIENDYETQRLGVSLSTLYGFDGSEWVEGALGFAYAVRGYAYGRMKDCGLR